MRFAGGAQLILIISAVVRLLCLLLLPALRGRRPHEVVVLTRGLGLLRLLLRRVRLVMLGVLVQVTGGRGLVLVEVALAASRLLIVVDALHVLGDNVILGHLLLLDVRILLEEGLLLAADRGFLLVVGC